LQKSTLTGAGLSAALSNLARLRIEVFPGFPYLCHGSRGYGESGLAALSSSEDAIIVAMDGAVVRPASHPLQPSNYSPLDALWEKRRYRKVQEMIAMFFWKQIDRSRQTGHPMRSWVRELG
jgi:hypothetical protein